MKPHREIRQSSRIGDPCSKYGCDMGRSLDRDIKNKLKVREKLKKIAENFLNDFFEKDIRYNDNVPVLPDTKKSVLLDELEKKLKELGLLANEKL